MFVFDAGPIIDLLEGSPDGVFVRDCLANLDNRIYVHSLNWMETFYHVSRKIDVLAAQSAMKQLEADGLLRDETLDEAFCKDAAQLKADWKRVSLADCCGVALARRLGAQFVSTDRHELEKLSAAGVCDIVFTR